MTDSLNNDFSYDNIEDEYRDELANVTKSGKRIWIYPKKPSGRYYNYRKLLSYLLLVILFGLPWIKYNGRPLFLFNVIDSEFILFGKYFPPQDSYLFVFAMLIGILFIVLFTVIFGRVFCGWICPQTIFMEMVYRRIEYWIEGDAGAQKKLNKANWTVDKILKKTLKHSIFFAIAVLIANTFLAYIIGMDQVLKIISEPVSLHTSGFTAMIIFSFVFYFVFASLREQVCTTICPYGRLQGVMVDDKSLAVSYDFIRGEPRGRIKKDESFEGRGDCIDCKLCVKVCPTGIDIRNGIQLECVNCTACMDACDEVMDKVNRPRGLIRIDSLEGIKTKKHSFLNKRSIAYMIVLVVLLSLEGFLLFDRAELETLILRTPGSLYYEKIPGKISNLYNYKFVNKTEAEDEVELVPIFEGAEVEYIGSNPSTVSRGPSEGTMFIHIDKELLDDRKTPINLEVRIDGKEIDRVKTNFYGPKK